MIKDTGREQRTAVVVRALVKEIDGYTLHSPNPYGLCFGLTLAPAIATWWVKRIPTKKSINDEVKNTSVSCRVALIAGQDWQSQPRRLVAAGYLLTTAGHP